jgi:hypothetical protein
MYECCNCEDAERGLGAFLEGWGDRTTKPFGLRVGRLLIFNLPPVSPGQRPFFLGFMLVFGESYLPLLGAIRTCFLVPEYGIYTYLYIGDFPFRFCGRWILLLVRLLQK